MELLSFQSDGALLCVSPRYAYIKIYMAELSAKRSDAAETFMSNGLGGVKLIPRACVCAAFILSAMCARVLIIYIYRLCARGCFYFFGRARGAFFLLDARGGAFILSVVRDGRTCYVC